MLIGQHFMTKEKMSNRGHRSKLSRKQKRKVAQGVFRKPRNPNKFVDKSKGKNDV